MRNTETEFVNENDCVNFCSPPHKFILPKSSG